MSESTRTPLRPEHAALVADRFGLGGGARLAGPVARGHLGLIWRLDASRGAFAVKSSIFAVDPSAAEADARYQEAVRASGVGMPAVVRTREGEVLAELDHAAGPAVRVYTWVDVLPEDRGLAPATVGRAVAAIHRVHVPAVGPVDDWYNAAVPGARWDELVQRLRAAGAWFADRLHALKPDLAETASLIEPATRVQTCHRDLWADNVRGTPGGGLCALDWENCGPADPSRELATVLSDFGAGDAGRMRALYGAYLDAGGPGRVERVADCSMLIAQLTHILAVGCERWLGSATADDRRRNEAWVREFLDEPIDAAAIAFLLEAVS